MLPMFGKNFESECAAMRRGLARLHCHYALLLDRGRKLQMRMCAVAAGD